MPSRELRNQRDPNRKPNDYLERKAGQRTIQKSDHPKTDGRFNWRPDWRTFVSGVLVVAALPPWSIWPLAWVCLVPWLSAVQRTRSWKEAIAQGAWLSYFVCLGAGYWVAYVLKEFGNLPWIVAVLGLQVFAVFGQLQLYVISPLLKLIPHGKSSPIKSLFMAMAFALTYAGLDWFLPKIFLDTLGHCFYPARHLRQLADIGGPTALTFLAYLVNDTVWKTLQRSQWKKGTLHKNATLLQCIVVAALCLICWAYGFFRYQQVTQTVRSAPTGLQAAAIQANIGDFDKIAAEQGVGQAADKILHTYISMSDQALHQKPRPEVIIWPETSYPSAFRKPRTQSELAHDQQVEHYAQTLGIPLLFGGYDQIGQKDYNAFFFLTPPDVNLLTDGNLQIYRKNVLLLFGEYIPGADTFDLIKETFPQVGNFGRGSGPEVLEIYTHNPKAPIVKAGPIICYEALFPNYVAEAARRGSQMIINITNDSWFGNWGEPQLHLALATFRSIETRLPMLRATNTGISALVMPDGEIAQATEIGVPTILNVFVPITSPIPTLIKTWGDWFGLFAFVVGTLGLGLLGHQARILQFFKVSQENRHKF